MRKKYHYRVRTIPDAEAVGSLVIEEQNDEGIWETIADAELVSIRDYVRVEQILIELNNIWKMHSTELFFM